MNIRIVAIWFAVAALTLGVMGMTSAVSEQVAHAQGKGETGCNAVLENVPRDSPGFRKAVSGACGLQ